MSPNRERVPLAVGQVWQEHDPRQQRRVEILFVHARDVLIRGLVSGRKTLARRDRFGGVGWGEYRFVHEDQPRRGPGG